MSLTKLAYRTVSDSNIRSICFWRIKAFRNVYKPSSMRVALNFLEMYLAMRKLHRVHRHPRNFMYGLILAGKRYAKVLWLALATVGNLKLSISDFLTALKDQQIQHARKTGYHCPLYGYLYKLWFYYVARNYFICVLFRFIPAPCEDKFVSL